MIRNNKLKENVKKYIFTVINYFYFFNKIMSLNKIKSTPKQMGKYGKPSYVL